MAVNYQSHTAPSISSTVSSVVVTKPTGLAVGDLMVAFISTIGTASRSIDVISGWTDSGAGEKTVTSGTDELSGRVIYKIADSGDTAASNFTFTVTGGTVNFMGASIHRIDGQNPNTPIDAAYGNSRQDDNVMDNNDGTYSANLTPTYASELYLMFISWAGGTSVTSQTIETSDPTFTEDYDTVSTLGMNALHATRTQTTSTGGMGFTISGGTGSTDTTGFLIIIKDKVSVTVSPSVINVSGAVPTPTITGGMTATPSVINVTGAVPTPSEMGQADWSTTDKSDTDTWTNANKS